MEEAIVAFLLENAALGQIVDGRITWNTLPQGQLLPAVVLTLIYSVPVYSDDLHENRLTESRLQIDCWALDYAVSKGAARAAFTQMSAAQVTLGGIEFQAIYAERNVESFELGTGGRSLYRVSQDFDIWHAAI